VEHDPDSHHERHLNNYEQAMAPARRRFSESTVVRVFLDEKASPDRLLAFLLHFCALGVAMTESVEGWIRRAGERCVSLGHVRLGRALIDHARHESGHDGLMRADTFTLAALWNRRAGAKPADPGTLLSNNTSPGVRHYRELHERTIAGPAPYAQIAIEYEIERLSVIYGGQLVHNCIQRIGPDVFSALSFVHEHIALDQGHTNFNRNRLSEFLSEHPSAFVSLVTSGAAALDSYGEYLRDCLRLGDTFVCAVSPG